MNEHGRAGHTPLYPVDEVAGDDYLFQRLRLDGTLEPFHHASEEPLLDGALPGRTQVTVRWLIGFWRGEALHRTTIEPSTRQFGLPA